MKTGAVIFFVIASVLWVTGIVFWVKACGDAKRGDESLREGNQ